jgi:cellulose synthase/poly-beta-1,6-N-acetylglucosamine synthase-like glycosyltransferase
MLSVVEILLVLVGIILALPVLTLFLQVSIALPTRPAPKTPESRRPRIAVLVPAHDEQHVIAETLASISRQLQAADRLVVVADNCSDQTTDIARRSGAEVTIRTDPILRGKGYALDHGLQFLEQTGIPEVVVVVDADCQLNDGCIDRLARLTVLSMRPMQAAYLLNPPRSPQKMASLVSFAWKVKDLIRPLGWHRLNLPCQLAGSGMAFPWEVLRSINLASGYLVEDLKLGLDLALSGKFPLFCPEAVVTSNVAAGGSPSYSQRSRWEHGSIQTMVTYLPRLFIGFCKAPDLRLIAMAMDLSIPPLALLALALSTHLAITVLFFLVSGISVPVVITSVTCSLFFVSIVLAWWRYEREFLPLGWLVFAPIYAIKKIPLYVRFVADRQRKWIKGDRERRG